MLVEDAAGNVTEIPEGPPSDSSWSAWLQKVAQYGLQRKWDAEYLLPFTVGRQVPYNYGTPLTRPLNPLALPGWVVAAGVVGAGALLVWALKD